LHEDHDQAKLEDIGDYVEVFEDDCESRLVAAMSAERNGEVALRTLGEYYLLKEALYSLELNNDQSTADVNTLYKLVGRKVHPVATSLPDDATDRIARAHLEPPLRPAHSTGHTFTDESLELLDIGGDGLLSTEELLEFRHRLAPLGKAFAMTDAEIGCVDPRVVAPLIALRGSFRA
jgi:hypothetical protein